MLRASATAASATASATASSASSATSPGDASGAESDSSAPGSLRLSQRIADHYHAFGTSGDIVLEDRERY